MIETCGDRLRLQSQNGAPLAWAKGAVLYGAVCAGDLELARNFATGHRVKSPPHAISG